MLYLDMLCGFITLVYFVGWVVGEGGVRTVEKWLACLLVKKWHMESSDVAVFFRYHMCLAVVRPNKLLLK